jgi:hypothetical protein
VYCKQLCVRVTIKTINKTLGLTLKGTFMRALTVVVFLLGCAFASVSTASESDRPSIANTNIVDFVGKRFELRFRTQQQALPVVEYFLPGEPTDKWSELVDFRLYPVHPDGNEPMDHAIRIAKAFKQQYPYMQFALYSDTKTGAAALDFFYPTSTRKNGDFLEFNAFKFFRDVETPHVLSFHYAKNIPGKSNDRTLEQVLADIRTTRAEVVPAIALLPLYRQ